MDILDQLEQKIEFLIKKVKELEEENTLLKQELEKEKETKKEVSKRIDRLLQKLEDIDIN